MKLYIYSAKGTGKVKCEDTSTVNGTLVSDGYYETELEENSFVAVADGVGGNAGGEIASRTVLEDLKGLDLKMVSKEYLRKFITLCNEKLIHFAGNIYGKERMATTLSGYIISPGKDYIFHVGNTRIYRLNGRYLHQLTKDHTTYQWMLNQGLFEEAEQCNKNELIACMGAGDTKYADKVYVEEFEAEERCQKLLLTSDGIHDYVSVDDLENFIQRKIMKGCLQEIAQKARENGSTDDQTIMVLEIN